jgi:DNA-binding transcriptional LysR family regulator
MPAPTPDADLGEILAFTRVVQTGSFTAAATSLGMPKSTVSRKISELEARVGARLLQRTTRTLSLTEVGRIYHAHALRIVQELEEAQRAVSQRQATPRGTLRVTTPVSFSPLGPILAELLGHHTELKLELLCTDRRVDLVEERFDLALRAGRSPDSTLLARKLGAMRKVLLASPEVAAKLESLKDPRGLAEHEALGFTPEGHTWTLTSGAKSIDVAVRARLEANDYDLLQSVARAGHGVALLPEYQCTEDVGAGRLVRVLEGWASPEVPVFALYPSTRHLSPGITALLDLLRERLALGRPKPR